MNDLNVILTRSLVALGGSPTPNIANAVASINGFKTAVEANPEHTKMILAQMTEPQARTMISALGTGNKDYKIETFKKFYFVGELRNFTTIQADIDSLKELASQVLLYGMTIGYANEKGEVGWAQAQQDIVSALGQRAQANGVAQERARRPPAGADVHMD